MYSCLGIFLSSNSLTRAPGITASPPLAVLGNGSVVGGYGGLVASVGEERVVFFMTDVFHEWTAMGGFVFRRCFGRANRGNVAVLGGEGSFSDSVAGAFTNIPFVRVHET